MNQEGKLEFIRGKSEEDPCDECGIFAFSVIKGEEKHRVCGKDDKKIPDKVITESEVACECIRE